MAITVGSILPISPLSPYGGTTAVPMTQMNPEPGSVFTDGDVLVIDATANDPIPDNTPGTVAIIGVYNGSVDNPYTAPATVDRNADFISVYLALPGTRFAGSLVAATGTDVTGVYGTDINVVTTLVESDTASGAFGCLDSGNTTAAETFVLSYSRQLDGSDGPESGVGVTNPRASFHFLVASTVFGNV